MESPLLSGDSTDEITEDNEIGALVRQSSFNAASLRRKRGNNTTPFPASPCRQQSFSREIGHAAAETYILTRLSFKLLSYLGVGYRWITRLLALVLYALFLMPGFIQGNLTLSWGKECDFSDNPFFGDIRSQVAFHYFFSSDVLRSVVYGSKPRNRLDIYLPKNSDGLKPVVIFVTGGAWIIGYKAWGALLGQQLSEKDIIVACLDYRNFPQGTISDMVTDVSQGIAFICNNIAELGGDPKKIYLMGQSAGAHISSCALLQQAVKESKCESIYWSASEINAYFGLSGGYDLCRLVDHFDGRGLYQSIFLSIMEGEKALEKFSPESIIRNPGSSGAVPLLPRIVLFHGTSDNSLPCDESKMFVDTLRRVGARVDLILFDGKSHTDLFLQDPLRGGRDELFDYLVGFIHADDKEALARDAAAPPRRRLVPELLLRLASQVSPF